MKFDRNGKLIVKSLKKTIKHEDRDFFDDDDYFDNSSLLVNYEKD